LGADFTRTAIAKAIENNAKMADSTDNVQGNLMAMIASASKRSGRKMDENTRRQMRYYGRQFGLKRAVVDELCNSVGKLTYAERNELWLHYREISDVFWEQMKAEKDALRRKINDEYARLRAIRKWCNQLLYCSDDLFSCLFAIIVVFIEIAVEHKIRNKIDSLIDERDSLKKLYEKHKTQKKDIRESVKTEDIENLLFALSELEKSANEIYHSHEKHKHINR